MVVIKSFISIHNCTIMCSTVSPHHVGMGGSCSQDSRNQIEQKQKNRVVHVSMSSGDRSRTKSSG